MKDGSQLPEARRRFPLFQQPPPNPLQPPPNQFYVSSTATFADPGGPLTNQAKFWNARTISYGALTPPLRGLGVEPGDFGLAIRIDTGVNDGFLYADSGNGNKVGESSRKLFRTLFPNVDQEGHPVAFIVFPASAYPRGGNSFWSNPTLAIRTRLWDLSLSADIGTVVGLMASGRKIRDFKVGTDPRNVGPVSLDTPQAQSIARALQRWGYDPEAALRRQKEEEFSEFARQLARENADLLRLKIPDPPDP